MAGIFWVQKKNVGKPWRIHTWLVFFGYTCYVSFRMLWKWVHSWIHVDVTVAVASGILSLLATTTVTMAAGWIGCVLSLRHTQVTKMSEREREM